jgi:heparan sulfate N-deacetylase/N-sulfotransferase NDST2
VPSYRCHNNQNTAHLPLFAHHNQSHQFTSNVHVDSKVLLFVETQYSSLGRQIAEVLEASRIKFKMEISGKSLPVLTNMEKGKFAVVIFENFEKYIQMNKWNRELLDKYCTEFSVGVIGFMPQPKASDEVIREQRMRGFPISFDTKQQIGKYILNPQSPVLRMSKAGQITDPAMLSNGHWTLFRSHHATYFPVAEAVTLPDGIYNESLRDTEHFNNVSSDDTDSRMMAIFQVCSIS